MKKTKKPSRASRRAAPPCSASLRVGGTGMTVAYCNLMRGHKGRHAQRYHPASGYGLAGHVSISWPNAGAVRPAVAGTHQPIVGHFESGAE